MKFDDSLLNSPNPITLDDLKTYFRKNDFTSSVNPSETINVRPNREHIYSKIHSCFLDAWNRSLKKLGIDLYGKQYSENAPLNILKQADSKIITEAVLDIIEDEERVSLYLNAFLTMMEEPLTQAMEAYAESTGKAPDELSDEELSPIVDRMADELLDKMMNLLQQTQEVPAVAQSEKSLPQAEDYTDGNSTDKIDFYRKWYHTRTSVGPMLSLDQLYQAEGQDDVETDADDTSVSDECDFEGEPASDEKGEQEDNLFDLTKTFLKTLSENDRAIFLMTANGTTQSEIAAVLGYQNNSAVSKRLKKIREQYRYYLEEYGIRI